MLLLAHRAALLFLLAQSFAGHDFGKLPLKKETVAERLPALHIKSMSKHNVTFEKRPSAKAQRIQEQIEKYPDAFIHEIEGALDEAAQQNLVVQTHTMIGVNAPSWLHVKQMAPISPKPKFTKLDWATNQLVVIRLTFS